MDSGGMMGQALMAPPKFNPFICWLKAFSWNGLIGMGLISAGIAGLWIYYRLQDRFSGRIDDPRGFSISKTGTYGTAGWMRNEKAKP